MNLVHRYATDARWAWIAWACTLCYGTTMVRHSTRATKLTAGYILDPDATREKIKAALRGAANVEAAAVILGVSERHLYVVIGKDDALRAWWKTEQEERLVKKDGGER